VELIKNYLKTDERPLIDEIETILKKAGTLSTIDPILNGIKDKCNEIDAQKLIEFAFDIAKTSESIG